MKSKTLQLYNIFWKEEGKSFNIFVHGPFQGRYVMYDLKNIVWLW